MTGLCYDSSVSSVISGHRVMLVTQHLTPSLTLLSWVMSHVSTMICSCFSRDFLSSSFQFWFQGVDSCVVSCLFV